jgi:protein-S-isoprenylcysteine O-methyltransferase Ste14
MFYRIRQFVYLGLGFFLLAMAGSVAKVTTYNQLWFWLSMVGFGAVMLVAFAAREKYQPILRRKIEEMESWDKGADETE